MQEGGCTVASSGCRAIIVASKKKARYLMVFDVQPETEHIINRRCVKYIYTDISHFS